MRSSIIVIAGASLMSSVPGLNARPRRVIFLSFSSPKCFLASSIIFFGWFLLTVIALSRRVGV